MRLEFSIQNGKCHEKASQAFPEEFRERRMILLHIEGELYA